MKHHLHLILDDEPFERIRQIAFDKRVAKMTIIRSAIEKYLKQNEKANAAKHNQKTLT